MTTCPNPSCGRVFATPLKTLNLRDSSAPYLACPYCLTKIPDAQVENVKHAKQEGGHSKEKGPKVKDKPQGCPYHLGFLSERENKQQIPEECIVCSVLLDCMLQKVKA